MFINTVFLELFVLVAILLYLIREKEQFEVRKGRCYAESQVSPSLANLQAYRLQHQRLY